MHSVKEVIIVEGRYDKNTLSQIVDAAIIETNGFGIFNNRQKQDFIRKMAELRGIVILTDPDGAGSMIRNFIKGCVPAEQIKMAYVPPIIGKEKRKSSPSKEGKLGVEGMRPEIILDALIKAGATVDGNCENRRSNITKADMYAKGLSGRENSKGLRLKLLHSLSLPDELSADALLDVLNILMTREEFYDYKLT